MGLSASQGRMLLLTARRDDLEFRAQQISQRRLILAQELEDISTDYEDATSNRQMKIGLFDTSAGTDDTQIKTYKNLTYANLISGTLNNVDKNKSGIQASPNTKVENYASNAFYRLTDSDGNIVISDLAEIPGSYTTDGKKESKTYSASSTAPTSADSASNIADYLNQIRSNGGTVDEINFDGSNTIQVKTTGKDGVAETSYFNKSGSRLGEIKDESGKSTGKYSSTGITFEKSNDWNVTYTRDNSDWKLNFTETVTKDTNSNELKPDVNGVYSLEIAGQTFKYKVDSSLANGTNSPNYLQDCLRNGKYLIEKGETSADDKKEFKWRGLSWDAAANINDSYYTDDDDVAKAKYDRLQNQIQNQDKKLELELDNIETQRSAVTTEVESVQKVMDDNVESTFKIFS